MTSIGASRFQSSPNPKVGRIQMSTLTVLVPWSFQSSPNPKVGRIRYPPRHCPGLPPVSILAQPEGRAHPGHRQRHRHQCGGVSILAQPEGRAHLIVGDDQDDFLEVSILAQPEGRAHHSTRFQRSAISRSA